MKCKVCSMKDEFFQNKGSSVVRCMVCDTVYELVEQKELEHLRKLALDDAKAKGFSLK